MDDFKKVLLWCLIGAIPTGIISVALPLYLSDLRLSYSEMGLIFSLGALLGLAINYFVGAHSDFVGRKPYLALSSVLETISFAILGFSSKIWHFTTASLFATVSQSLYSVSAYAYLLDILPKSRRGYYLGLYAGIAGMFYTLGIFLSGGLVGFFGYQNLFFACALFSLIPIALSQTLREKKKLGPARKKNIFESMAVGKISFRVKFVTLIFFVMLFSSYLATLFGYPLYLKSLGADIVQVGFYMGILGASYYAGQLFFGKLSDSYNPARIFILTFMGIIPINIALIFVSDIFIAGVLLALCGIFMGMQMTAFAKVEFESVGISNGRDMAFISNGNYIGLLAGALIGGITIDYFGFAGMFLFRSFGGLVAIILMVQYLRRFG